MIRISSTTLEQYRLMIQNDFVQESELIAQVRGEPFEPTWQMRAGTAFHKLLETPQPFAQAGSEHLHQDGLAFLFEDVLKAKEYIGPGVWEAKQEWELFLVTEIAKIVCKVDHINGLVIQDNKTKWGSTIDTSAYDESLQWRLYLLAFGCQCFRYNIFAFKEPDADGYCHLKDIVSVRHWAYPGMEQDCIVWIRGFLEWAKLRHLTKHLHRQSHEKGRPTSNGM